MYSSEYLPRGPSESSRVRLFAQNQYDLLGNTDIVNDRVQFMNHLQSVTNEIIGVPRKHSNPTFATVTSTAAYVTGILPKVENPSAIYITANLKSSSFNSLDKLRSMRHRVQRSVGITIDDIAETSEKSKRSSPERAWDDTNAYKKNEDTNQYERPCKRNVNFKSAAIPDLIDPTHDNSYQDSNSRGFVKSSEPTNMQSKVTFSTDAYSNHSVTHDGDVCSSSLHRDNLSPVSPVQKTEIKSSKSHIPAQTHQSKVAMPLRSGVDHDTSDVISVDDVSEDDIARNACTEYDNESISVTSSHSDVDSVIGSNDNTDSTRQQQLADNSSAFSNKSTISQTDPETSLLINSFNQFLCVSDNTQDSQANTTSLCASTTQSEPLNTIDYDRRIQESMSRQSDHLSIEILRQEEIRLRNDIQRRVNQLQQQTQQQKRQQQWRESALQSQQRLEPYKAQEIHIHNHFPHSDSYKKGTNQSNSQSSVADPIHVATTTDDLLPTVPTILVYHTKIDSPLLQSAIANQRTVNKYYGGNVLNYSNSIIDTNNGFPIDFGYENRNYGNHNATLHPINKQFLLYNTHNDELTKHQPVRYNNSINTSNINNVLSRDTSTRESMHPVNMSGLAYV